MGFQLDLVYNQLVRGALGRHLDGLRGTRRRRCARGNAGRGPAARPQRRPDLPGRRPRLPRPARWWARSASRATASTRTTWSRSSALANAGARAGHRLRQRAAGDARRPALAAGRAASLRAVPAVAVQRFERSRTPVRASERACSPAGARSRWPRRGACPRAPALRAGGARSPPANEDRKLPPERPGRPGNRPAAPGRLASPSSSFPPPADPSQVPAPLPATPRQAVPVPDRWRIMQALGFKFPLTDPYNQNILKGDLPIGDDPWLKEHLPGPRAPPLAGLVLQPGRRCPTRWSRRGACPRRWARRRRTAPGSLTTCSARAGSRRWRRR